MKARKSIQSIGRIQLGQTLRITKRRHIPGTPVLDSSSWVRDVTGGDEGGGLLVERRVDGGVMLTIGSGEFFIGVSPLGPLLNHGFGHVEIIANQPNPEGGA